MNEIINQQRLNELLIAKALREMEKLTCHDCAKTLQENEEYMEYPKTTKIKCKECHIKEPKLKNYQECEEYSRVVGYIRPVKQWNPGKKEEYKDRKEFKV